MGTASKISRFFVYVMTPLLVVCGTAIAANVDDLYQAQTVVTGQREETRGRGLAQCLTDVLVKVSGDARLIDDPRVATLGAQASAFAREFGYRDSMSGIPIHDEQGTRDRPYELTVSFYPDKIDAALRSLGREPWTASRPRVVVFVGVRNVRATYLLASDGIRGPGMPESLASVAGRVGMPMALPTQAALAKAGLSFEKFPAANLADLDAAAKTIGGDLALVGNMVWSDEALGWIADWRLVVEGKTYEWRIRGVNFDGAFRSALRGAAQILSGNGQPN